MIAFRPTFPGLLVLLVAALCLGIPAAAQVPATDADLPDFFLDLDTGGHRAFVRSVAFSADGEVLVSASDDRSVRIWDWRAGVAIRTLRGQIGEGSEGKVNTAAISADGTLVATGGVFGPVARGGPYGDVRLFETRTGKMAAVLKGQDSPLISVAFSPDDTILAAGSLDGFVDLWRRADTAAEADGWTLERRIDTGASGLRGVAFLQDGTRLATVSRVVGPGLWDVETGNSVSLSDGADALRDTSTIALAISPDGARLAVAALDGAVHVLDADGGLVRALPPRDFLPAAIAFAGADRLIAACSTRCGGVARAEIWQIDTATLIDTFTQLEGNTFAIAVAPDGTTVATAEGARHSIELWQVDGTETQDRLGGASGAVTAVGITPDGTTIAWGHEDPCPTRSVCYDVAGALDTMLMLPTPERSFVDPVPGFNSARFNRAVLQETGINLRATELPGTPYETAELIIERDGALDRSILKDARDGYVHTSFTLLPGAATLVTGGGDGSILAYVTATGAFAAEFRDGRSRGHDDDVLAMAAAARRAMLITGSSDQTVRLWNTDTHKLVSSLYAVGRDWVLWTPEGYYHSSPAGDRFVGWHVNQGPDREARFITARQLKRHLNSPEIVRRSLILGDAGAAATELRGTDTELARLMVNKPLEFSMKLLNDGVPVDGQLQVEIVQYEVPGVEAESFGVRVNDRLISTLSGRDVSTGRQIVNITLTEGANEITVTGFNTFGYMTERGSFVLNPVKTADEKKGTLYLAVVGIQDYPLLPKGCNGRSCDLRYPVADAAEFLRSVALHAAPLYKDMVIRVMLNADALKDLPGAAQAISSLIDADDILEPEARTVSFELVDFLELAGPEDTTIIFLAGHGMNLDEDYYLLPSDARQRDDASWRRASLVDWRDIQEALDRAKGRKLLFIDTCHAGNAFNAKLEKDAIDSRISVISATAANNVALELPELGHGVFSYAVIRGLDGAARGSGGGVGILDLAAYVSNEVVRLSNERQTPVNHFQQPITNFLVAKP